MMKLLSNRFLVFFCTLLLSVSLLGLDSALAQRRGGGRGSGSFRGAGGGGASPRVNSRTNLQNRGSFNSSSQSRQGSSSQTRQTNRGQATQNRQGNQQNRQTNRDQNQQNRQVNRDQNQQNRQVNRDQVQQNRQGNQQNRQNAIQDNQQNRQGNQQNRQDAIQGNQQNRQNAIQDNQQNRQNFIDDNYYGGRWYGGGWYGGGYYAPPGWGAWTAAVGFTTGVIIGASVASPPPYYSTVYVDSTPYIYSDGVYLQSQGSSYVVVAPPMNVVVTYLPEGCTVIQTNGTQYYDCSGIYYQTVYQNGATVYRVVDL